MSRRVCLWFPLFLTSLYAQNTTSQEQTFQEILHRLDTLERQNRELREEVRQLKEGHVSETAAVPPIEERVKVAETRIAEQAQTKVESSQKFPVSLYGTFLFNAFSSSKDPTAALGNYGLLTGSARSGATLRQTILGLEFHGPSLPGGGHVEGDLGMDFWSGPPNPSNNWLRIRRAGVSFVWPTRSVFFGQDKPLISPYEPNSLAEVGVPSMAGTGNLWFWLPQARFEQKVRLGSSNGIKVQVAVLQVSGFLTSSAPNSSSTAYSSGARPALEARIAFWHKTGDVQKFEIAPGFQASSNHVAGVNVNTQIASLDWSAALLPKLEWKGLGYYGDNVASLGSLGNGFYLTYAGQPRAVRSAGGWTQLSSPVHNRVTFNAISGFENDQSGSTYGPAIAHSFTFAGNAIFHLSPNVLLSVEAQRLWTRTFRGQFETYNHYDLAVAYQF